MIKAKKYKVTGRVQGVGFRYFTQYSANRIGVKGFVKNCYDGSVEVYAIGTMEQLDHLKQALVKGPSMSNVTGVAEENAVMDNSCINFKITY